MDKRYQVFMSSTYADLKDERQEIMQILMGMDCIPAGMELFPAIDDDQFEFIKKIIDDCDYYLLIIGGRYGSVDKNGISFTEREYDYAVSKGINVIAFVPKDVQSMPAEKKDAEPVLTQKLLAFISKVKEGRLVKEWDAETSLSGLVAVSLQKTIKTYPAVGWIRADTVADAESQLEIVRLKEKVRMLEAAAEDTGTFRIANLAPLSDTFTIHYTVASNEKSAEKTRAFTWNEIFIRLASIWFESPEDSVVLKTLVGILMRAENLPGRYTIDIYDFNVIKIQFIANNFISYESGCWELTPLGKRYLVENIAVRTT